MRKAGRVRRTKKASKSPESSQVLTTDTNNFLLHQDSVYFLSISVFCSLANRSAFSFTWKIMNVPCMCYTWTYITRSYKQNSSANQRFKKKKLCLFMKFLIASFISKTFSLFETHWHRSIQLEAGNSYNELCSVLRKIVSEGSFFLLGSVDEQFKKNKVSQGTTHNRSGGVGGEVGTFLLIKISSSDGPLYTQIPVKKGLQDQACTKKKYTIITLIVLLLHNANQPGLYRRD